MGSNGENKCLTCDDILVQLYVTLVNRGIELDFQVRL